MNKTIFSILLLFFTQIFINQPSKAVEINCNSPVHKNKPRCKGETGKQKKEETTLDPETGLMVIEMESDIEWAEQNPKIPYNNIVKLTSALMVQLTMQFLIGITKKIFPIVTTLRSIRFLQNGLQIMFKLFILLKKTVLILDAQILFQMKETYLHL